MDDNEYRMSLGKIQMAAKILHDVNTSEMLNHISHVETVGPFMVAPFEYQRGLKNLDDAKALVNGAAALMAGAEKIGFYKAMREGRQTFANGMPAPPPASLHDADVVHECRCDVVNGDHGLVKTIPLGGCPVHGMTPNGNG